MACGSRMTGPDGHTGREVHVGRQVNAVAHRHLHIAEDANVIHMSYARMRRGFFDQYGVHVRFAERRRHAAQARMSSASGRTPARHTSAGGACSTRRVRAAGARCGPRSPIARHSSHAVRRVGNAASRRGRTGHRHPRRQQHGHCSRCDRSPIMADDHVL